MCEIMRTFTFKNVDPLSVLPSKETTCEIEMELKTEKDKNILSMSGSIGDVYCGQCFDEMAETSLKENDLFRCLYKLWKLYHLNDMHAGTPEQEEALKQARKENIIPSGDYTKDCEFLKSKNLYEVTLPDGTPYKYGHSWLYEPIPEDDLQIIKMLIKTGTL